MQHQKPYTLKWLRFGEESYMATVMVGPDRTRNKKSVIKTRTSWDSPAETQFEMAQLPEEVDSTGSCYYFWDCMDYAAVSAFLQTWLEEEFDYEDRTPENFFKSLPKPDFNRYLGPNKANFTFGYVDYLVKAFPQLKISKPYIAGF